MSMVRAVIFDCFGVLTTDTWHAFLDSLPVEVDIQQARDLNRAFDSGLITHAEFFDGVQQLTGSRPLDIEAISTAAITKNNGLLDVIADLKKSYKIGLLSNISSDWITRELLSPAEQELFNAMVFSYQVGVAKPDPRIYQIICSKLDVDPSEAVMVDDIERNITAAHESGMQGIVYTDLPSFTADLNRLLDSNN